MILHMRKLRHIIDTMYLAQDHTASKLRGWDLNSDILAPHGNPLQYSFLENPMDRGVWWTVVHGVAKSSARLSN